MNNTDLERIAEELINEKIARGDVVKASWAVNELIAGRGEIRGRGDTVDFFTLCAREHVYRVVKKAIDKREPTPEEDPNQMKIEGFEHLRNAYTVERDGERVIVPIDQLSDSELLARAAEYDRQAEGCRAHAREIRSYLSRRNSAFRRRAPAVRRQHRRAHA